MRVLVCGGRDFCNVALVYHYLDQLHAQYPVSMVIHGAARGADSCGASWATSRGTPQQACPADWNRDGRAAGPIRNQWMLDNCAPQMVVAFPGGKGTDHMVRISQRAGVPVWDLRGVRCT